MDILQIDADRGDCLPACMSLFQYGNVNYIKDTRKIIELLLKATKASPDVWPYISQDFKNELI
jgi:hypothetical protein